MKHIYLIIIIFITTFSFSQEEKIVKAKQNAISSMSLVDALSTRIPGARRITDRMGNKNIALRGRQSFKTAGNEVIWEIDGIIYNNPPVLSIEQVKYVEVLNGLSATNKYGSEDFKKYNATISFKELLNNQIPKIKYKNIESMLKFDGKNTDRLTQEIIDI